MSITPPRFLVPLLAFSAGISIMSSTIYVPAMTEMAAELGVQIGDIQLTLLVYIGGIAIGQLAYGPLSDAFGRRRVFLGGMLLCLAASIVCMFASSIAMLLVARMAQACGACAGLVISRAIIGDLYEPAAATKALSLIGIMMTFMPGVAPMIGGNLDVYFGWRSALLFIAVLAAAAMALLWFLLPETNPRDNRRPFAVAGIMSTYRTLLGDGEFMTYSMTVFGTQFGAYVFVASAPVILVGTLGVSPDQYGYFSALSSTGYLFGSFVASKLSGKISSNRLLGVLGFSQAMVVTGMIAASLSASLTPWHVIVPMALFMVNNGMAVPNAFSGAVALYPRVAGTASALSGFLQGCGGVAGILAAYLLPKGLAAVLALALMLPVVIMLTTGLLLRFRYRRLPPPGGRA